MKKMFKFTGAMLLAVSMLTACAGEKSGGSSEGDGKRITLYSPETPDFTKELAKKYEEVIGGNVDVHYAGTNVLVNQMLAEKENPKADVWYGGGGILPFEAAVERGILASYIPDFAADWDITENGIKLKHEDGKYVGVEIFVLGFSYNPELVSEEEAPKTWEDLLDPKWKGKIQFPNPAASGTATLMVMDQMMRQGEDKAWEYFEKLVDQANSTPDSGSAPTKAVAMGEAHIGIGFDFMAYEQKAKGETVDFIVPDKTPVLVNPATLIEGAPNAEGGKKFIDFLLSKEAQQIMADWYHIPINPEVESKTPLSIDKVKEVAVDLDIDWVNENYDRVRNEWKDKFQ
ncbi:ABC transporter substrate-binding protein [Cytobacillus solani]|uniref:ABC transporter substrate-binding protein n=1 Tax=Cytobacillus solani TaxID=1637975 RepID=A0A0Q3VFF1_9BACI|nr:extracellular solute-binding protein [Cytobacillus solani]KOP78219.1 ABC transporter substrate-binding protein [Bacillus sp. FJAT-21945]KQL17719.1 ABC transporter substrate-binding protein [Cytobacillus solani]